MKTGLLIIVYFLYATLNTTAMAAIKSAMLLAQSAQSRKGRTALVRLGLGGILYIGAIAALTVLLRKAPASTVFPIAIGSTVLATNVAGVQFYGEQITARKLVGTLLVLGGVALTFYDGANG